MMISSKISICKLFQCPGDGYRQTGVPVYKAYRLYAYISPLALDMHLNPPHG